MTENVLSAVVDTDVPSAGLLLLFLLVLQLLLLLPLLLLLTLRVSKSSPNRSKNPYNASPRSKMSLPSCTCQCDITSDNGQLSDLSASCCF
jgi:hypothetical protein